jgi:hypothetical protein
MLALALAALAAAAPVAVAVAVAGCGAPGGHSFGGRTDARVRDGARDSDLCCGGGGPCGDAVAHTVADGHD